MDNQATGDQALQRALSHWRSWAAQLNAPPRLEYAISTGLSHSSYCVRHDQQRFIVRIESAASRSLAMPKQQELTLLNNVGSLAPSVVWHNATTLVSHYIEGHTWQAGSHIESLAAHLYRLHHLKLDLPAFDLLKHIDRYWRKLEELNPKTAEVHHGFYRRCRQKTDKILRQHPLQCICHNDLIPDNILQNKQEFVFIDWEYAGLNSPYFDLASLVEFGELSKTQALDLSNYYWKNDHDNSHVNALKNFCFVVRFLEWLWLCLQYPEQSSRSQKKLTTLLQSLATA